MFHLFLFLIHKKVNLAVCGVLVCCVVLICNVTCCSTMKYIDRFIREYKLQHIEGLLDCDQRDRFRYEIEDYITTDSIEVIDVILKSKIDIDHVYPNGLTVLHVACLKGFSTLVKHLLLHGASSMIADTRHFLLPLHICAQQGNTLCIEALLLFKANISVVHKLTGKLPLHFAAQSGSAAAVQLLLSADNELLSINATDCEGHTPLHLAVIDGNSDIVRLLLQQGCNTVLKDCNGKTAIDLAQMLHRDDIVRVISGDLFAGMCIISPVLTQCSSSAPPVCWVAVTDGTFARMANGQIPLHRSKLVWHVL